MASMAIWNQMFPQKPELTEANLPSQKGKVFVVTGGTSGVGYNLCKILYQSGGKVYVAGRSPEKGAQAIDGMRAASTSVVGSGELHFLQLELDNLSTIKASAEAFKAKESRLDVLWNNAGTGAIPQGGRTAAGHEVHMGTNAVGPFLFTKLLLPVLKAAPQSRVIWTSSLLIDFTAPIGGFEMDSIHDPTTNSMKHYTDSKTANWFLASELGRRCSNGQIISLTQNPGNLRTALLRHVPWYVPLLSSPFLYDAQYGAYTELWAGLSEHVTSEDSGRYVIPWGRWHPSPRQDLLGALKSKEEGGTGRASEYWDWCEQQTATYC